MGLERVQGFSTTLVKTAIGQFTNLHQADLQSLNASQAMKGTLEQPGSFSMVEALLNLLPSHLRIASDLALESSLQHVKTNYDVIASYLLWHWTTHTGG